MIENIRKVLVSYQKVRESEEFTGCELGDIVRNEIPENLQKHIRVYDNDRYIFRGSIGQGGFAEVPWIAILDKEVTESVQEGYFVVFLFSTNSDYVYLSLNQGWNFFKGKFSRSEGLEKIRKAASNLSNLLETENIIIDENDRLRYVEEINLNAENDLGIGYEYGHIIGYRYGIRELVSLEDEDIYSDIENLLESLDYLKSLQGDLETNEFILLMCEDIQNYDNYNFIQEAEEEYEIEQKLIEVKSVLKDKEINYSPKEKIDNIKERVLYNNQRDPSISAQALINADYKCEYNEDHETFISQVTGKNYVEAHHIIPISVQDDFEYSIDNIANVVALCPTCHRAVHNGKEKVKIEILEKLYSLREDALRKSKIDISLERLMEYYGINK